MGADQNMTRDEQADPRVARRGADFLFILALSQQIGVARQARGNGRGELRQLVFVVLHAEMQIDFSCGEAYAIDSLGALT
jgi:hypothetical protein